MSTPIKPHLIGPILNVLRPKQYALYNEADVATFNKLEEMNAQIDALKLENEQLLHCCKGQGAGSRRFRKHMRVRKGTASRRRHKNRK
jgi:hypothetical protein